MFKFLSIFITNTFAQTTSPYVHYPNRHGDSSIGTGFLEEMWKQYPIAVSFVLISMFFIGVYFFMKLPDILRKDGTEKDL